MDATSGIDIEGLDKAALVMELVNSSRVDGHGFRFSAERLGALLTYDGAQALLDAGHFGPRSDLSSWNGRSGLNFDVWRHRLDPLEYDWHNGPGAAQNVVDRVRAAQSAGGPPSMAMNEPAVRLPGRAGGATTDGHGPQR